MLNWCSIISKSIPMRLSRQVMKTSQLNKLYDKLTAQEQATLCFEAAIRQDDAELEAIKAAVEWGNYRIPNYDFRQRSFGLFVLGGYYGTEYWKNLSLMLMALGLDEDKDGGQYAGLAGQFSAKLAAMDAALADTSNKLRVDVGTIRKMAGCLEHFKPVPDVVVHAELVQQYGELFETIAM